MPAALAIARSTLATTLRGPLVPAAALLGCLALWAGANLDVLALGQSRAGWLGVGTAEAVGIAVAVLAAVRRVSEDEASGVAEALDGGGPGTLNRLTGRFLGAWALASLAALPPLALGAALQGSDLGGPVAQALPLRLALELAAAAGWAVLLARLLPPGASTLAAALVVLASRGIVPGAAAGLAPRPVAAGAHDVLASLAQALVAAAAVLGAAALPRTREG